MKKASLILLVLLGAIIPAAHAHRWHGLPQALAWLVPTAFLFTRREFVRPACQIVLAAGAWVTFGNMIFFIRMRLAMDMPWTRLAIILSAAALLPLAAAWALRHPFFRRETSPGSASPLPGLACAALSFAALALVQGTGKPMLLAERFWPGSGWLEAALLAMYAGFAVEALLVPGRSPTIRRRLWAFFSLIFFGQLLLGLAGLERFLMTGALHLPVPALIVAGPLFRGDGLFMLILFACAVLLAGPAWCSHLCYIGAWDMAACANRTIPGPAPSWLRPARAALAAAVFLTAWILGRAGLPGTTAAWLAAGFGLVGVGVMLTLSRRMGLMIHCSGYCPMGLVAGLWGKVSAWRLSIGTGCTQCGACRAACRYDALRPGDLEAGRPGLSCSLCTDCLCACPRNELALTFFGLRGAWVRQAFAVLTVSLHALFLGVARL